MSAPDPALIVAELFGDAVPVFQGEGPSIGEPALFIRLSRCNLACSWCDSRYTWDWAHFDPRLESTRLGVAEAAAWALGNPPELVVITGGEPLLQRAGVASLARSLVAGGKRVEIETNGTVSPGHALRLAGVRFNVSPKLSNADVASSRRIVPRVLADFAASGQAVFKFVAASLADLDEISSLSGRLGLAPVYVMPEATTAAELQAMTRVLAGEVACRGWRLTSRLHILAYGDQRGR